MTVKHSVAISNALLDVLTAQYGAGAKLAIYNGTRPAGGGTSTTKLAEFTLGSPFAAAASGRALAPSLPADVTALATGTATWARITKADGTTYCTDLDVGTSGKEVNLASTTITSGGTVSITSFAITRNGDA